MDELKKRIHSDGSASEPERSEYGALREKLIQQMLSCKAEDFLEWQPLEEEPPHPARIRPSVVCDRCGEQVMETRIRKVGGKNLCIPCMEQA